MKPKVAANSAAGNCWMPVLYSCTELLKNRRDAAILFSIQDRPVLEALGLYREEAMTESGGHQKVSSSFKA